MMEKIRDNSLVQMIERANSDEALQSFSRWQVIAALALVFVIGSVFGFVYEEIFYFFNDDFHLVHRGTQVGPRLPIYGFGALFMVVLLFGMRKRPLVVFLGGGAICGVLEYATGWFCLTFMQTRFWDYNTEILNWGNVGGFICFRSVFFFAVSGLLLMYVINPLVREFAAKAKPRTLYLAAFIPAGLYLIDVIISVVHPLMQAG